MFPSQQGAWPSPKVQTLTFILFLLPIFCYSLSPKYLFTLTSAVSHPAVVEGIAPQGFCNSFLNSLPAPGSSSFKLPFKLKICFFHFFCLKALNSPYFPSKLKLYLSSLAGQPPTRPSIFWHLPHTQPFLLLPTW